jgi:hypothetical protein
MASSVPDRDVAALLISLSRAVGEADAARLVFVY